nr:MAG TPA: tail protein [Caudoviricetes sp.]
MYQCWVENEYGDSIELTNNKDYTVYQIDGLEPPTATINTSPVANFDGSRFNSSRSNERNIVLYLTIEGDVEENRIGLYTYIKSKRPIRFRYKNSARDVYIDGYVESMQIGFFDMKQAVQVSIICPYPLFKSSDRTMTDFSTVANAFIFPFAYEAAGAPFSTLAVGATKSIINGGDVENGVIIKMIASGLVLNPQIFNHSKNEYFRLNVELSAGDEITINTNKSQKGIILTHNGDTSNIINDMVRGSTWFQLLTGDNVFSYGADEYPENLSCTFIYTDEFEGV